MTHFEHLKKLLKAVDIEFKAEESDDTSIKDHWIEVGDEYSFQVHPDGDYIILNKFKLVSVIGGDHTDPVKAVTHLMELLKDEEETDHAEEKS